jgi:Glycosyltransferase family 87
VARLVGLTAADGSLGSRLLLLFPALVILFVAAVTPTRALFPDQGDVNLYFQTARQLALGHVPYRDFAFHYPPGALLPMAVPLLAQFEGPIDLDIYKVLFAGWEAALMLVLGLVLARMAERIAIDDLPETGGDEDQAIFERVRGAGWRVALLSIGAALALTWRYDLFPAVLVMLAVWAAIERRAALAGVILGLGVLVKLYPIAVLPALALPWLIPFDFRRLARLGAGFGLALAAGLLPFVILAGRRAIGFFDYQVGHGIQIESIGGGIAVLVGLVTGTPAGMSFDNARVQVEGPVATAWLAIVPLLTIVGFAVLAWLGWRRSRAEVTSGAGKIPASLMVALAGASVLMVLVTSKVYSIQYVVWLLPFMALLRGRIFWLAAAITALTMPIHPLLYSALIKQEALPVLILNLRNGLLVVLALWFLASLRLNATRLRPRFGS